jgi:DNA-binding YbaB/EbfC family protein
MQIRGGMSELLRQAQRMQRKIDDVKKGLKDKEMSAGAAGDKV